MAKLALVAAAMAGAFALASAQYAGYAQVPQGQVADPTLTAMAAPVGGVAGGAGYAPAYAAADPATVAASSSGYRNVYEALQGEGLTDFQALADSSRLSPLLKNASIPSTVFVPSNQAVAQALSDMQMDAQAIAGNKTVVTYISFYHVVPGRVFSEAELQEMGASGKGEVLPTMRGYDLEASVDPSTGNVVLVGGTEARLVPGRTNIKAGNSTVHVIDYLLLPQDTRDEAGLKTRAVAKRFRTVAEALVNTPQLSSTARAAANDPQLASVLSSPNLVSTVFAPNNAAWANLAKTNSPLLNNAAWIKDSVAYSVATNRALSQDELRNLGPGSTLSTLSGAPLVVGQMSTAAEQALVGTGDVRPMAQEAGELMGGMPAGAVALMMSSDSGMQSVGVVGQPLVAGRSIVHEVDGVLVPKAVATQVQAIEAERKKQAEAKAQAAAMLAAEVARNATAKAAKSGAGEGVAASVVAVAAAFAAML